MAGVYISYPFCAQKCTYCNFASGVFPRDLEARYTAALQQELERHPWSWVPETLYLGGGTPSSMEPAALEFILSRVPGRPWLEATLECAPGTITADRARSWAAAGLNRVSLGVQSFVSAELSRTGRRHSAEEVAREVELLRGLGIGNFNVDLIAGLAGQTAASWQASLDWVERLDAPHVSVYMLEIDEDSRLGREILAAGSRFGASDVPSEELTADLYEMAVERLAGIGVHRYEISNFARPGFESRHNLKYWRLEPYIGFGADAHSFDGGMRWQNVESPAEYVERAASPRGEMLPAADEEERFFVSLRLSEGVRVSDSERLQVETNVRHFVEGGLLEWSGDRLRLTSRGVLLSNEVFQEFLHI
ncbi:MAG: radical SAM family heme chaperone HemW [Bryobacteraceae bacterium]